MRKLSICTLVIVFILANIILPMPAGAKTLREAYKELEEQKKQAEKNQQEQANTNEELKQITNQLQKMAANIEYTKEEINNLKDEIEKLNKDIELKSEQLKELAIFRQISDGDNAYLEYALDTKSVTEFVYRMAVIKQLMEHNERLVTEMEDTIEANKKKTVELQEKQKSFEKQKKDLEKEEEKLESQKLSLQIGYSSILEDIEAQKQLLEDAEARGCKLDDDINNCGESLPNNTRLLRPTTSYRITSVYDPTGTHPSRLDLPKSWRVHTGTDVGAVAGTSVYALGYGVVTRVAYESCGGNYIWITYKLNGNYYSSGYYHLSTQLVKTGDVVTPNTVVGRVGSTGSCTTGPHLHFELTKGARYMTAGLYGVPKNQVWSSGAGSWRIDPTSIVDLPGYWERFDGR